MPERARGGVADPASADGLGSAGERASTACEVILSMTPWGLGDSNAAKGVAGTGTLEGSVDEEEVGREGLGEEKE